ncbi:hypothetical protein [Aeromonas sobria]|uniref:hypothetical protein n=1 Tax=Aeromonas sobria TaxID=646 RepID=UPI000C6CD267|nr:hypothetical protein [Aeromonas sobria]PKQ78106.1 hypothetical protein CJF47_07440 [Aeromonas sobria]
MNTTQLNQTPRIKTALAFIETLVCPFGLKIDSTSINEHDDYVRVKFKHSICYSSFDVHFNNGTINIKKTLSELMLFAPAIYHRHDVKAFDFVEMNINGIDLIRVDLGDDELTATVNEMISHELTDMLSIMMTGLRLY